MKLIPSLGADKIYDSIKENWTAIKGNMHSSFALHILATLSSSKPRLKEYHVNA